MDPSSALTPPPGQAGPSALREEALEALRALTGRRDATFHDGQYEAIAALVEQRRRVLVVQRTGWGNRRCTSWPRCCSGGAAPARP